jgi:hypothetical protein
MAEPFLQDPPRLANPYRAEPTLARILARRLPRAEFDRLAPGLDRLGELAADVLPALAAEAERDAPRHVPYDAWGQRIDALAISPAWRRSSGSR